MVIQFSIEKWQKSQLIWKTLKRKISYEFGVPFRICDDKWKVLYLQVLFAQNMKKIYRMRCVGSFRKWDHLDETSTNSNWIHRPLSRLIFKLGFIFGRIPYKWPNSPLLAPENEPFVVHLSIFWPEQFSSIDFTSNALFKALEQMSLCCCWWWLTRIDQFENDQPNQLKCAKFNYFFSFDFMLFFFVCFVFFSLSVNMLLFCPNNCFFRSFRFHCAVSLSSYVPSYLFYRLSDRLFTSICKTSIYFIFYRKCLWENNAIIGNQSCSTNRKQTGKINWIRIHHSFFYLSLSIPLGRLLTVCLSRSNISNDSINYIKEMFNGFGTETDGL